MTKSIMQTDKQCYLCGRETCLERHHVLAGTANRKLSEKYGLWVWLCHDDHVGVEGAQYDKQKNWNLKRDAQIAFENVYDHDLWFKTFKRNYVY